MKKLIFILGLLTASVAQAHDCPGPACPVINPEMVQLLARNASTDEMLLWLAKDQARLATEQAKLIQYFKDGK